VNPDRQRRRLIELARLFLWLGTIGFGGPPAHLTLIEEATVRRRKWLSPEAFVDLVGLTNLIPGPNSTEMAMVVGYRRAGWPGLVVAGLCFIAPAAAITVTLAWAYVRFGALPGAVALLAGTAPAVVAVMAVGVVRIGRTAIRSWPLLAVAIVVAALALAHVDPFVLLVGGAICGLAWGSWRPAMATVVAVLGGHASLAALASLAGSAHPQPRLVEIATFFLKIGAILYGSGYVLVALLRTLVSPLAWLTEQQLLDSIAAGQVTPGPVLTTATFIGYLLNGPTGALVATIAIFLPAFFFVSILEPVIGRVGTSPRARRFLDLVNATAIGLMAGVTIQLTGNLWGRPRLWPAAIVAAAIGLCGYSAAWMLLAVVLLTLLVNVAVL
jgi:chromate transporter